jgi:hypothetical protein
MWKKRLAQGLGIYVVLELLGGAILLLLMHH